MSLSLSVKKIKDHCLEFLSLSIIHFDIIMISLHFAREWKMIHKRENCWGRLRTMKLESQRRHLSCLWVDKYDLNFIYKNVSYCLMFIVSSILFYFIFLIWCSYHSQAEPQWCGVSVCGATCPLQLGSCGIYLSLPLPCAWTDLHQMRLTDDSPTLSEITFIMQLFNWYINQ